MLNRTPLPLTLQPSLTSSRPLSAVEREIVGIWILKDSYDLCFNGQIVRSRGQTPSGFLSYHPGGPMAVQVMNDGRPSCDPAQACPEETKAMLTGYTAYFGTFEVNVRDSFILHHMQGNLFSNEVGTTRKRFYDLSGKRLTLTTPAFETDGEKRRRRIVWERFDRTVAEAGKARNTVMTQKNRSTVTNASTCNALIQRIHHGHAHRLPRSEQLAVLAHYEGCRICQRDAKLQSVARQFKNRLSRS